MPSPFDTIADSAAPALLQRREDDPLSLLGLHGDDWGLGTNNGKSFFSLFYKLLLKALERDLASECRCECPPGGGGTELNPFAGYQRPSDTDSPEYGKVPDYTNEPSRYEWLNDPGTQEWTDPSPDPSSDPPIEQFDDTQPTDLSMRSQSSGVMPDPTGVVVVNEPIVVKSGEVFDGGNRLYRAGPGLGDGGQGEGQQPLFILEHGATLRNVQIEGADGVHCYGDARLENVWWRDVGEDALTMKGPGDVVVLGGGAYKAEDKIFQLNAGGSFRVFGFHADGFGKAIRTNGGKEFDIDIQVRDSVFANGEEAVVRTDAHGARVAMDNVQAVGLKSQVLAPVAANVSGAASVDYKPFSG